jgi:AcrR family transcriptional regulator
MIDATAGALNGDLGLRERNRQERLSRIRAAAFTVFREKGYAAATTREIAARAGVASGTLFAYAREKRDLLLMIFDVELGRLTDQALATMPTNAPLLDQLMHFFRARYEWYASDPDLSRHAVHEIYVPMMRPKNSVMQRTEGRLTEFLTGIQTAGIIDGREGAALYARILMDLYLNENQRWVAGDQLDVNAGLIDLRNAFRVALRGMGASLV